MGENGEVVEEMEPGGDGSAEVRRRRRLGDSGVRSDNGKVPVAGARSGGSRRGGGSGGGLGTAASAVTKVKYPWPGQGVVVVVAAAAAAVATQRRAVTAATATAVGLFPQPSVSSH